MVTMRDVAALAGVSAKTVSRVFNNDPHVTPATKDRVEAALRQLNYVPSTLATTFRSGRAPVIGVAVETMCKFRKSLVFPQIVDAGLRVGKLGNSSVRYEVGLFAAGDPEPAAVGHFVHVFVERATMRPVPIPNPLRACMERLLVAREAAQ
jgi:acyl-CoA thioesterase FadM